MSLVHLDVFSSFIMCSRFPLFSLFVDIYIYPEIIVHYSLSVHYFCEKRMYCISCCHHQTSRNVDIRSTTSQHKLQTSVKTDQLVKTVKKDNQKESSVKDKESGDIDENWHTIIYQSDSAWVTPVKERSYQPLLNIGIHASFVLLLLFQSRQKFSI